MVSSRYKAVIFDIGGVVVGSPIVGAGHYEKHHGLPEHWINVGITAWGHEGSFQRLERGELPLDLFYKLFGEELSKVEFVNKAYKVYCTKMKIPCPVLPTKLTVDGRDLWEGFMMKEANKVDDLVVEAIISLRDSRQFKTAALTNNFHVPGANDLPPVKYVGPITIAALNESLRKSKDNPQAAGAPNEMLKALFDDFVESAKEGMRKPSPAFYIRAMERLGVTPEETIFLDDIGLNLVAARKLGITTIRVLPDRSLEAIQELERLVGIPLIKNSKARL